MRITVFRTVTMFITLLCACISAIIVVSIGGVPMSPDVIRHLIAVIVALGCIGIIIGVNNQGILKNTGFDSSIKQVSASLLILTVVVWIITSSNSSLLLSILLTLYAVAVAFVLLFIGLRRRQVEFLSGSRYAAVIMGFFVLAIAINVINLVSLR